jgi:hypothetical protein
MMFVLYDVCVILQTSRISQIAQKRKSKKTLVDDI